MKEDVVKGSQDNMHETKLTRCGIYLQRVHNVTNGIAFL